MHDALPVGWISQRDSEGRTFYAHVATGQTQWERPFAPPSSPPPVPSENDALPDGWVAMIDQATNCAFYADTRTGQTQWARPIADFPNARADGPGASAPVSGPKPPSTTLPSHPSFAAQPFLAPPNAQPPTAVPVASTAASKGQAASSATEREVVITRKPAGFDFALKGEPRVTRVLDKSEAHRLGMVPGDKIVAVNRQRFPDNPHKWFDVFRSSEPPLTLTLEAGPPLGLVDSVLYRVNSSSPAEGMSLPDVRKLLPSFLGGEAVPPSAATAKSSKTAAASSLPSTDDEGRPIHWT